MLSDVIARREGTQLEHCPAPVRHHREFIPPELLLVLRGLAGPKPRRRKLIFKQRKGTA